MRRNADSLRQLCTHRMRIRSRQRASRETFETIGRQRIQPPTSAAGDRAEGWHRRCGSLQSKHAGHAGDLSVCCVPGVSGAPRSLAHLHRFNRSVAACIAAGLSPGDGHVPVSSSGQQGHRRLDPVGPGALAADRQLWEPDSLLVLSFFLAFFAEASGWRLAVHMAAQ